MILKRSCTFAALLFVEVTAGAAAAASCTMWPARMLVRAVPEPPRAAGAAATALRCGQSGWALPLQAPAEVSAERPRPPPEGPWDSPPEHGPPTSWAPGWAFTRPPPPPHPAIAATAAVSTAAACVAAGCIWRGAWQLRRARPPVLRPPPARTRPGSLLAGGAPRGRAAAQQLPLLMRCGPHGCRPAADWRPAAARECAEVLQLPRDRARRCLRRRTLVFAGNSNMRQLAFEVDRVLTGRELTRLEQKARCARVCHPGSGCEGLCAAILPASVRVIFVGHVHRRIWDPWVWLETLRALPRAPDVLVVGAGGDAGPDPDRDARRLSCLLAHVARNGTAVYVATPNRWRVPEGPPAERQRFGREWNGNATRVAAGIQLYCSTRRRSRETPSVRAGTLSTRCTPTRCTPHRRRRWP
eukprot:TRINITY_DN35994_c0_g1_i4.p1 TRINITY_DN35994_c0_g1~~TRINITY_DN35994_c0_g1_i4.p1  ORF type:complete len:413 (+),score=58.84 TRINITY_DN35994_c0_g1_i4:76-1314(+)